MKDPRIKSNNKTVKIGRPRDDWRMSWSLGLVLFFIYYYFHLNFYHFYLYFFIVGIISFISSFIPVFLISDTGLTVRWWGLFNKNELVFDWQQIKIARIKRTKKRVAGGARFPVVSEMEISGISLNLIEKPLILANSSLNKNGVEWDEDNVTITFYLKTEDDFETILHYISKFCITENNKYGAKAHLREKRANMVLDFTLVIIFLIELAWQFCRNGVIH